MVGRCYKFTKKLTEDQAYEFLREMHKVDDILSLTVSDDGKYMTVQTKDDEYATVMWKAINVSRRVAGGCEMEFDHFAYED